jgi:excisionase family DNA binding protein
MTSYQPDSALLSVQEAADALCVSAQTVHRWIAEGTLPVQHVGDRPVIRTEDVARVLRSKIWLTPSSAAIWAPV